MAEMGDRAMNTIPLPGRSLLSPGINIVTTLAEIQPISFEIIGTVTNASLTSAANPVSAIPIMPEGFVTYTDAGQPYRSPLR
jgi:hypothetical protein